MTTLEFAKFNSQRIMNSSRYFMKLWTTV